MFICNFKKFKNFKKENTFKIGDNHKGTVCCLKSCKAAAKQEISVALN